MQGTCYGMPMQVAGRPMVDRANRQGGFFKVVSPSYFSTLRLKLVQRPRALGSRRQERAAGRSSSTSAWRSASSQNEDPIGAAPPDSGNHSRQDRARAGDLRGRSSASIRDEKVSGIGRRRSAGVYVSNEQSPVYFMTLNVRTSVDPLSLQKADRAAIHSVNKDQALNDIRTVDQIKSASMASNRLQSALLGVFGGGRAAAGGHRHLRRHLVFGGAAHARDRDPRRARRARGSLLRLVLGRGVLLTVLGLAVGIGGALGLTRLMATLLYGVGARDPATMVAVAAVLAAVAAMASYVPARRATKVDPIVALRYE